MFFRLLPLKGKTKSVFALLLSLSIIWTGCSERAEEVELTLDKKLVLATTTHLADLARQLGGDRMVVESLMGPGVDPHSYRATAKDVARLHAADLILFHGFSFEGKIARVLEEAQKNGVPAFSPCLRLSRESLMKAEGEEKQTIDPHLWFDPDLWILCAQALMVRLTEESPEDEKFFKANLIAFEESVRETKDWGVSLIHRLPKERRILITSHDAFRYLGRSFDLEVIALQGINTLVEAGLADRANLVELVKRRQCPALFIESSVNPKAIGEIAKETGAVIGGSLFSDALGTTFQTAVGPNGAILKTDTWQGMMAHNLSLIQLGLASRP